MAVRLATTSSLFSLLLAGLWLAAPPAEAASPAAVKSRSATKSLTKLPTKIPTKSSAAKMTVPRKHPTASRARKGKATVRSASKRKRVFLEQRVPWMRGNQPNVQSAGALVIDLDTGEELFLRKPEQPRAIASISKLAAALVIMDRKLELDALSTMSKVDLEVARGGAASRLPEGMTLTNRDLLHAAMLGSDNRAVSALGRAVGLNATQFAEAMNRKVASLGLKQTRFREPTGLSPENVSTPRELVKLLRAAMNHPVLGPIMRRPEYDAHPVSRPAIKYVNTHKPAARGNTQILGGKTGYNDSARYCLVLAARVDGRRYGMAFLGTEGKMTRFGDVARVADWIAVHKPARKPISPLPAGGMPDVGMNARTMVAHTGAAGGALTGGAALPVAASTSAMVLPSEAMVPAAPAARLGPGSADGGAPAPL